MFLTKSDVQLLESDAMFALEGAREEAEFARFEGTPDEYWVPEHDALMDKAHQLWWLVDALGDKRPACPEGGVCTRRCSPMLEAMTGFSCAKQFVAWETTDVHDNYEF
jgi:hypothetical protein